jgi:hypothetical protein
MHGLTQQQHHGKQLPPLPMEVISIIIRFSGPVERETWRLVSRSTQLETQRHDEEFIISQRPSHADDRHTPLDIVGFKRRHDMLRYKHGIRLFTDATRTVGELSCRFPYEVNCLELGEHPESEHIIIPEPFSYEMYYRHMLYVEIAFRLHDGLRNADHPVIISVVPWNYRYNGVLRETYLGGEYINRAMFEFHFDVLGNRYLAGITGLHNADAEIIPNDKYTSNWDMMCTTWHRNDGDILAGTHLATLDENKWTTTSVKQHVPVHYEDGDGLYCDVLVTKNDTWFKKIQVGDTMLSRIDGVNYD